MFHSRLERSLQGATAENTQGLERRHHEVWPELAPSRAGSHR